MAAASEMGSEREPTDVLVAIVNQSSLAAGKAWGIVAAQPELSNGGKVSTGGWSVSSVLSHEVLEMNIDPTS